MGRTGSGGSVGLAVAAGLLALGGCAPPSASPWRPAPPPPAVEGPVETVFCYRTLADVACYFERDPGVPGRLVAVYPRPTGDPASATYWRRRAAPGEPAAEREAER